MLQAERALGQGGRTQAVHVTAAHAGRAWMRVSAPLGARRGYVSANLRPVVWRHALYASGAAGCLAAEVTTLRLADPGRSRGIGRRWSQGGTYRTVFSIRPANLRGVQVGGLEEI